MVVFFMPFYILLAGVLLTSTMQYGSISPTPTATPTIRPAIKVGFSQPQQNVAQSQIQPSGVSAPQPVPMSTPGILSSSGTGIPTRNIPSPQPVQVASQSPAGRARAVLYGAIVGESIGFPLSSTITNTVAPMLGARLNDDNARFDDKATQDAYDNARIAIRQQLLSAGYTFSLDTSYTGSMNIGGLQKFFGSPCPTAQTAPTASLLQASATASFALSAHSRLMLAIGAALPTIVGQDVPGAMNMVLQAIVADSKRSNGFSAGCRKGADYYTTSSGSLGSIVQRLQNAVGAQGAAASLNARGAPYCTVPPLAATVSHAIPFGIVLCSPAGSGTIDANAACLQQAAEQSKIIFCERPSTLAACRAMAAGISYIIHHGASTSDSKGFLQNIISEMQKAAEKAEQDITVVNITQPGTAGSLKTKNLMYFAYKKAEADAEGTKQPTELDQVRMIESWGGGFTPKSALAAAVYLFSYYVLKNRQKAKTAEDYQTIVLNVIQASCMAGCVNAAGIGALAGALTAGYYGFDSIPPTWPSLLEGQTEITKMTGGLSTR